MSIEVAEGARGGGRGEGGEGGVEAREGDIQVAPPSTYGQPQSTATDAWPLPVTSHTQNMPARNNPEEAKTAGPK